MTFEWHNRKEKENIRKHYVDFYEASTCFSDPLKVEVYDEEHSIDEDRFILLGISYKGRLLTVCHVERGYDHIRIISARTATKQERVFYNQGNQP